jgi:hypothetical protein
MSAEQPGREAGQWPGPPAAAERKAAAAEDDFTRDGTEPAPERADTARVDDSRVDDSERVNTAPVDDSPADDDVRADGARPAGATGTGTAAPGLVDRPVSGPADGPATLLEPDHTEEFRRRWDAIKASFVDDPREAVRRAEQLAEEVVAEVARTVDARRRDLIERREGIGDQEDKTGTERLRVVLHGYRSVLDPVLRR